MRFLAMVAVAAVAVGGAELYGRQASAPVKTIEEGVLDEMKLYTATLEASASTPVVMRPFSASDSDLGTGSEGGKEQRKAEAKTMQEQGPKILADAFAAKLKALGPFTSVSSDGSAASPAAIVIEGKFTSIDPGSRAKRYFVGFGAGKSVVEVAGTVKMGDRVLATFKQKRLGVMGNAGGDSLKKLTSDTEHIGEDIAKFLSTWANGKSLK
jgi:hypothetical protein